MKKKIFSLLLIFTMFFGFAIINVEAQAEFIDDTFVISNSTYDVNDNDVIELLLLLGDYVETYDLLIEHQYFLVADLSNVVFDGFYIDFNADLASLDYTFLYMYDTQQNSVALHMTDYNDSIVVDFIYFLETNEFTVEGMATYDFNIVITLPVEETIEEEGLSIFGFFKNFYSNYIFPNNILDSQTLNLITAVTTLLFFIGVFRGIWSIFKGKRK